MTFWIWLLRIVIVPRTCTPVDFRLTVEIEEPITLADFLVSAMMLLQSVACHRHFCISATLEDITFFVCCVGRFLLLKMALSLAVLYKRTPMTLRITNKGHFPLVDPGAHKEKSKHVMSYDRVHHAATVDITGLGRMHSVRGAWNAPMKLPLVFLMEVFAPS